VADKLDVVSTFNLEARYPDEKRSFRQKCTPEYTNQQMIIIREIFSWLQSHSEITAETIKHFIEEVSKQYELQEVYVFGSQGSGRTSRWSDIDLLIVSPDFVADRHEARISLMRIARKIDLRIEPHPIAPDEFNPTNPFVYEVQRSGIRITI